MDSNIQSLPEELLLKILLYGGVDSRTVLNFGETCKQFNTLVQDPLLWKKKLKFRYPKIYHAIILYGTDDFIEQYRYVHKLEAKVLEELNAMSPKYFWQSKESTMGDALPYFNLCKERNISFIAVHAILVDAYIKGGNVIDSDYPSTTPYSLTVQYYANHIIRFMMHMYLMMCWIGMSLTLSEISPEKTLNFFVNWMGTSYYKDYSLLKTVLDRLADEVIKELPPSHPIHLVSAETKNLWVEATLENNQWSPEDNLAVHSAIKHVLYTKNGLKLEPKMSIMLLHIPLALKNKKAHYISMAVLYEAVARRCGIKCVILAFSDHFFLEWRENCNTPSCSRYRIKLDTGNLERLGQCPFAIAVPTHHRRYNPEALLGTLTGEFRKLLNTDTSVSMIIKTKALDQIIHGSVEPGNDGYSNIYIGMRADSAMNKLLLGQRDIPIQNLADGIRHSLVRFGSPHPDSHSLEVAQKRTVYRNRRSCQVHYAVGMVCGHQVYKYHCVLIGWDPVCSATQEWQARMNVHRLQYRDQQPFYNVYATDGSTRYVAQENLILLSGQRLKIIEDVIGMEFSHFNGTFYIPNAEKQQEYPDEKQVIAAYRRVPALLMSTCKLVKPAPAHMHTFNWRG